MQHENALPTLGSEIAQPYLLADRALAALERAILRDFPNRIAVVSSFGAQSVVLLHMIARVDRGTPVLFVETGMLFQQTLDYQRKVAQDLGLADVRTIVPQPDALMAADPAGDLHKTEPDDCCRLRKVEPLERALDGFAAWVSGRKHYQSTDRKEMPLIEQDRAGRTKLNPLAAWRAQDLQRYMAAHALPPHPLVAEGYRSIGCAPCTTPVRPGEDERAGRWRGSAKTECGIHSPNRKKSAQV